MIKGDDFFAAKFAGAGIQRSFIPKDKLVGCAAFKTLIGRWDADFLAELKCLYAILKFLFTSTAVQHMSYL